MKRALLIFPFLAAAVACQTDPTRITEDREVKTKAAQELLAKNVILLDARPPFYVAAEPIKQAIPVQWRDFVTRQAPFENHLEPDLFFHARRLARMGIGPDTPVIVLGRGGHGEGEEGRLAWTLRYMGVKDVKFMTTDEFRFPNQINPPPDRSAVPMWKPEIVGDLSIENKDFLAGLKAGDQFSIVEVADRNAPVRPKIDIPKGLRTEIVWGKLSGLKPEARTKALQEILGQRIAPIVVIDNDGVKAASATLWLRDAGYTAKCLCSGIQDLKSQ